MSSSVPSCPPCAAPTDPERRRWLLATTVAGAVGTAGVAVPFVSSFAPSERAKALGASVVVDPATIAPG
jgi:ubiquinol-cytochrome c reductase iron-sulfur subunit